MLDLTEVGEFVRTNFTATLFRLETLQDYNVPTDGGDVARYLAGEQEPDMARKQTWLDRLASEAAEGKVRCRVRVLRSPLSGYERYACEWGYAYNVAAGERVRVLDLAERVLPEEVEPVYEDFYLLDGTMVLRMRYDESGAFVAGEVTEPDIVPAYSAAASAAWEAAVPFTDYWNAHPEYHRDIVRS